MDSEPPTTTSSRPLPATSVLLDGSVHRPEFVEVLILCLLSEGFTSFLVGAEVTQLKSAGYRLQ